MVSFHYVHCYCEKTDGLSLEPVYLHIIDNGIYILSCLIISDKPSTMHSREFSMA